MKQQNQKLSDNFYVLLSLPATAMGFALSVQISALSWILSTQYGLKIDEVGYVWLAGPVAGIIGQLTIGFVSDETWLWGGRRRPYILVGGILTALMLFCLPNLTPIANFLGINNMMIVALIVALSLDLAINISFNPTRSLIADVTPEGEARTKGYTWMQTISGAFGVLAYLITVWYGNYTLIYVGVLLVLLFSIVPTLSIKEPRHLTVSNNTTTTQAINTTIAPDLWRIYIAHGFTWLGVQTMFVFMFAYIQQHLTTDVQTAGKIIAMAFLVMNVVGFLLPRFILEPISEKLGRVRTHAIAIAIMALGYALIYYAPRSEGLLYVCMAIVGIGWAATVSIPFAIVTEKVSSAKTGWYMGVFNLSVVIPQILVSALLSKFIEKAPDKAIIFVVCMVCLAISAILWHFIQEPERKK